MTSGFTDRVTFEGVMTIYTLTCEPGVRGGYS